MKEKILSVKRLLFLAVPMMLGSAAQNIIALTDSLFLYHYDANDFAAVGFVSVFYLLISAIGYGFSKGGQILIARKFGERDHAGLRKIFHATFVFELILAIFLFTILQLGAPFILKFFVESEVILTKSLEFLKYRSYGVFFSYSGLAIVSLYMGISRPKFILIDTLILAVFNFGLNYVFVFGKYGFPEMGIAGAGLGSALSEGIATIVFLIYMFFDKRLKEFNIFSIQKIEFHFINVIRQISIPILWQSVVGIGSWFIFFSLIEKLGEHALGVSNVLRIIYLILSIPAWGFASAINTLVSKQIGKGRLDKVMPVIYLCAWVSVITTSIISLPVMLFPDIFLYPLMGSGEMNLMNDAKPYFVLLFFNLFFFSLSTVYFNALSGTGATLKALNVQIVGTAIYLILVAFAVANSRLGLSWAWGAEILYWLIQWGVSYKILKKGSWSVIKF